MPTLTVNGRQVQVEDSFAELSPEQQNATVDEIAKSIGALGQQAAPGGMVRNFAAGANEAIAGMLGGPVDVAASTLNQLGEVQRGLNAALRPSMQRYATQPRSPITNPFGGTESVEAGMGLVGADPREVFARSLAERLARGAGAGAVGMAAPYMAGRAMIAGGIGAPPPSPPGAFSADPGSLTAALARVLGGPAAADAGALRTGLGAFGNAAIGGAAGAAGAGAEELLPEGSIYRPLANFGGQMVGGGLMAGGMGLAKAGVNAGAAAARDVLGPMRPGSLENLVADKLRAAASGPEALARSLAVDNPELVPGSFSTTFQLSGDQGIGRLQRGLNPEPFEARLAEQNAARSAAVQGLAPEGANSGSVRDLLQQRLAHIDAEGETQVAAARQNAQQAFDHAGGRLNPEDYGTLMRDQLEAAKAVTKRQESALWQAIDPEAKLKINATPVRDTANRIWAEIPKTAQQPQGEEAAIFGFARLGGTAQPFSDFAALRGRLLQAIREERFNGQTPALRRMTMLRQSMDDTISELATKAANGDPSLVARLSERAGDIGYGGAGPTSAAATAGGLGRGVSPVHPGGGPQYDAGLPGAAGYSRGGFGRAAGYPGVSEPPRPQDIVQFLRSRGGLQDEGGELRALDLHKLQGFGRVVRSDGMPLDRAREAAVEAGYLHPDSDINDLLAALRRNAQGQHVFSESDPAAVEWRAYDRTRQRGEFEPMPPLPGEPANWDAAAAARYRAAADATRNRAATFNNPQIGPVLRERGGAYQMAESRIPERFISSPEGVQAYVSAGGDPGTLRDALVADLRRSATSPDGTLSPTKFASWQLRRNAALRAFPDMQQTLGDVAQAQQAVDTIAAAARRETLGYEQGAARHFLKAEPTQAVQAALSSKNPVADMRDISRLVASDPDAKAGLQRAVADYIAQRFVRNPDEAGVGTIQGKAFGEFMKRNLALREVFTPEQMQAVSGLAADLQRSSRPLPRGTSPGGQFVHTGKLSLLSAYAGHGLAGMAGYLLGGVHGAVESAAYYAVGKSAVNAVRRSGIERTDQLLTEALLNPELAKTLLMKATPGNRVFIAQRLGSQLGTLAASAGVQATAESRRQGVSSQAAKKLSGQPSQRTPAVWPPQIPGSLVPGGALRVAP